MEIRFHELMVKDLTRETDVERIALFHILAGNSDLYKHIDDIYNFEDHCIKTSCFRKAWLTSSTRGLLKLGFNLFNNSQKNTTYDSFVYLDHQNTLLALEAIKIRFLR